MTPLHILPDVHWRHLRDQDTAALIDKFTLCLPDGWTIDRRPPCWLCECWTEGLSEWCSRWWQNTWPFHELDSAVLIITLLSVNVEVLIIIKTVYKCIFKIHLNKNLQNTAWNLGSVWNVIVAEHQKKTHLLHVITEECFPSCRLHHSCLQGNIW